MQLNVDGTLDPGQAAFLVALTAHEAGIPFDGVRALLKGRKPDAKELGHWTLVPTAWDGLPQKGSRQTAHQRHDGISRASLFVLHGKGLPSA